jgi:hypothetical protein
MFSRVLMATLVLAACSSSASPDLDPPTLSQGIVAGTVRDASGQPVPNAAICAAAAFAIEGTPFLVRAETATNANGRYVLPLNLDVDVDVRAGLVLVVTPLYSTGLAPRDAIDQSVLIMAPPPPAETSRVNFEVVAGMAHEGVLCPSGP